MTKFFDDIEAAIKDIHIKNGVDNDTVTKEIADAVTTNVEPLKQQLADQQTQLTSQQTQIEELQQALQDTVAAIKSGDTDAALATATAATNGTGSSSGGDAGSGDDDNSGAGQATS